MQIDISLIYRLFTSALDILVVSIMTYMLLKLLMKSQKHSMIINGVFMFVIIYGLSNILNLQATSSILSNIYSWGIVIIVILFQTEIRDSLEKVGQLSNFFKSDNKELIFIEELADTVYELGNVKTGALISITKEQRLNEYTKNSVAINAEFSKLLLKTIFNKEAPLHDGAVVIDNEIITHACVYYPIELDLDLNKQYGTRHRAALTISKQTDCLTVIVSEETGEIGVTYRGLLYSGLERSAFIALVKEKMESGAKNE